MQFLKISWHHIRRSPYQAIAAIFIMAQTFFVISFFAFIIFGSARIISYFESLPQVSVFFNNEAKQENIDALKEQLKATGKTSKINFISKQAALKIYKEQNKDDPILLEFVTADMLPASLEISAVNINDLSSISDMIKKSSFVKMVIFPKDVVSNLVDWTDFLRKIGMAIIAVLTVDCIFIMMILIGIKISKKRDEIEILRLIGATNWYVRWPFIYEGVFYGVIGALLGWISSVAILFYAVPFLKSVLGVVPIFPVSTTFLLEMLGLELVLAIVLGIFSSFLAVLRYLK